MERGENFGRTISEDRERSADHGPEEVVAGEEGCDVSGVTIREVTTERRDVVSAPRFSQEKKKAEAADLSPAWNSKNVPLEKIADPHSRKSRRCAFCVFAQPIRESRDKLVAGERSVIRRKSVGGDAKGQVINFVIPNLL